MQWELADCMLLVKNVWESDNIMAIGKSHVKNMSLLSSNSKKVTIIF